MTLEEIIFTLFNKLSFLAVLMVAFVCGLILFALWFRNWRSRKEVDGPVLSRKDRRDLVNSFKELLAQSNSVEECDRKVRFLGMFFPQWFRAQLAEGWQVDLEHTEGRRLQVTLISMRPTSEQETITVTLPRPNSPS